MTEHAFLGRDIISIAQFSKEELLFILDVASQIKNGTLPIKGLLKDKVLISAFFEDSTRTRNSFERAMDGFSGKVKGFAGPAGTSLNKGETIMHTLHMFKGYGGDAIVIRHKLEGAPQAVADVFAIPVINAGDGTHEHPTQTLLDLFSILETQKKLEGITVAIGGDLKYGRTTHSLAVALSLFSNNKIIFVSPESLRMPEHILVLLKERNISFEETTNMQDALLRADIFYMTRLQKERLPDDVKANYDKIKDQYRITSNMLLHVKPNLRILHPLPIDKFVQEISSAVEQTPHCYYFDQARNGLFVRQALLGLVLGAIPSKKYVAPKTALSASAFRDVQIKQDPTRTHYKIGYINNGVVIDHLPAHSAADVLSIIDFIYADSQATIFVGENLKSNKMSRKDLIKIESEKISSDDLSTFNKLALKYPSATLSFIKNAMAIKKGQVILPLEIHGMIRCLNGNCVSRQEHKEQLTSHFIVLNRDTLLLRCYYCDTVFGRDQLYFEDTKE